MRGEGDTWGLFVKIESRAVTFLAAEFPNNR